MSSKPSTAKVPRGLRVLKKSSAPSTDNNVQAERSALMKEIAQIDQWWRDPRWKGTTRPYSGAFRHSHSVLPLISSNPNHHLYLYLSSMIYANSLRRGLTPSFHRGSILWDHVTQMFLLQHIFSQALLASIVASFRRRIFSHVRGFGSRPGGPNGST